MILDPVSEILAEYFVTYADLQLSFTDGDPWYVTVSNMFDTPDNAVSIKDTQPFWDGRYMRTGENVLHYGCTIAVRSVDYPTGYRKAASMQTSLEKVKRSPVNVDGNRYVIQNVSMHGSVIPLGQEKNHREFFVLNTRTTLYFNGIVPRPALPGSQQEWQYQQPSYVFYQQR